ncbi:MAG: CBS domain-containing protein [Rhodospirillales bacterium]
MSTVQELLSRKAFTDVMGVTPDTPLAEAATTLRDRRIGILVVRNADGDMIGVFSERDLVRAVAVRADEVVSLTVGDMLTDRVETCTYSDDLRDVVQRMGRGGFRHMPVMENGKLIGIVSISDIFRYLMDHAPQQRLDAFQSYYCT